MISGTVYIFNLIEDFSVLSDYCSVIHIELFFLYNQIVVYMPISVNECVLQAQIYNCPPLPNMNYDL